MGMSQDMSDSHWKSHLSNPRPRNDTIVPEPDSITRDSPKSSDDDGDFLDLDKLLSSVRRKSISAAVDLSGDDGGEGDSFVDIDEFLSGIQQESVPANGGLDSSGMADTADDGSWGGSRTDSNCTTGSTRDPIILSDNESLSAESDTDYSDLDPDVRAKSDPHPPHVANSEPRDGEGFRSGSGAVFNSGCLVTDHHVDNSNHNDLIDTTRLRLWAGVAIERSIAGNTMEANTAKGFGQ